MARPDESTPRSPLSTHDALLDLARRLLTPGADLAEFGDGREMRDWVAARIAWHRLDGNTALADELLREENAVREALGKEPFNA